MWYHQKVWSRTTTKFSPGTGSKFTHAPRPCGKWFEVICWRSLKQSYCRENCSQRTDSTTRKRSGASFYACLTNCTHSEAPLLFFLCSWNFDCKDVHIVHWKFGLHEWSLSVWHFVIIRWILFFSHKMFFAEYFVWDLKKNTNVSLKKNKQCILLDCISGMHDFLNNIHCNDCIYYNGNVFEISQNQ